MDVGEKRSGITSADERPGRRRPNRRGEGARLRNDLVDAAAALVAEAGHARDLSLRAVARRAGIATTSVYPHFADVDALKSAVAERGHAELDRYRHEASRDIADPASALLARCRGYGRFAVDHPGYYRVMFGPELPDRLAYDAADSPGRRALTGLAESIGRCSSGADSHELAVLVWGALHGMASLRIDRPRFDWPMPLDRAIDEAVRRLVGLR